MATTILPRRAVLAALLLLPAALATAGDAAAQRYSLDGRRVALYNLVGEVTVQGGPGGAVVMEVARGGADAERLRITRGNVGDADALRIAYPGDRIVYRGMGRGSRSTLRVNEDGTFGGGWRGGRTVTVSGSGGGTEAWANVTVSVPAGRTVEIHQGVGRVAVSNVNGDLRVRTSSAGVEARGTRGTLDVDVGSGRVSVSDASGDVKIDTGSGAVRVTSVAGGRLEVDTGSGGVTGSDLRVTSLKVDVGSGRVALTGVRSPDVDVDSGSGSVALALEADARSVKVDTGSGGVTLTLPSDFGAQMEIDTGSGGITVDVPATGRRSSRGHWVGRIGDGNGRVQVDTGSGGVRVRGG